MFNKEPVDAAGTEYKEGGNAAVLAEAKKAEEHDDAAKPASAVAMVASTSVDSHTSEVKMEVVPAAPEEAQGDAAADAQPPTAAVGVDKEEA